LAKSTVPPERAFIDIDTVRYSVPHRLVAAASLPSKSFTIAMNTSASPSGVPPLALRDRERGQFLRRCRQIIPRICGEICAAEAL
jgi:hypothetical protein